MDQTLSFIKNPYTFIRDEAFREGKEFFYSRVLLRKTIFMTGPDAARLFYNQSLFERKGSAPEPIKATLFGKGGVQGLDGIEHKQRKALFLSLMTEERINDLSHIFLKWLNTYAKQWKEHNQIILYQQLQEILTLSVCEWAGIELKTSEVSLRTRQLTAMFDSAGNLGHFRARVARKKSERWIQGIVEDLRKSESELQQTPLERIVFFKDSEGKLLSSRIAAVEILNLLRPTVAISVYIVFSLHALIMHPENRKKLLHGSKAFLECFIQEVRRFYPFFPAVYAKVKKTFTWKGVTFLKKSKAVLDIYGTNHDMKSWKAPDVFLPERFIRWNGNSFNFIPQGGGEHENGHRCPGEWITKRIMQEAVIFFLSKLDYKVPEQNLDLNMGRLPALPYSYLVLSDIKVKGEVHPPLSSKVYDDFLRPPP